MDSETIISSFTTLFVVIDPVGLAPIFLALTFGMGAEAKRKVAVSAAFITFVILAIAAIGGEWFMRQIGIGIPAFRIAGGLLLFFIAFEMVLGDRTDRKMKKGGVAEADGEGESVAVFPLAIPLMAGPGAITASVLLSGNTGGDPVGLATLIGIIAIVTASAALAFLFASRFEHFISRTWQIVFARLLGIILAALAVQIVIDGIAGSGLFD